MTTEQERDFYKEELEKTIDFLTKELHSNYGPCDGNGTNGNCSECEKRIEDLKDTERLFFEDFDY